eukprot:TRINITY_DN2187_c0_g1_i1.p1 TRINITY_DN2187_c0_g1~~TRINITY_DN2187_c0_g1_i1.p1  ORF type:complete len:748 (+),score=105.54 TRINITY_DN2187_c0_g1_i1:95-2338(+)
MTSRRVGPETSSPPTSPTRGKRVVKRVNAEEAALIEKQAEDRRMNGRRGMAFYGDVVPASNAVDPMGLIPKAPCSNSGLVSSGLASTSTTRVLNPSKHLIVGYAEAQGRRQTMEDEVFVCGSLGDNPSLDLIGLFDGHNGDAVSKYLANAVPNLMRDILQDKLDVTPELFENAWKQLSRNLKKDCVVGGSTALVALFFHEQDKIFIANVGDCRAVLGNPGIGKRITDDHRPGSQKERQRIEALGGSVSSLVSKDGRIISRVNGVLAVSRSFGDFELGAFIEPVPDVFALSMSDLNDGFLIMACDGLWDVMGDNDATDIVKRHFDLYGNDLEGACVRLRDFAYANGSTDNITVLIIATNTALLPRTVIPDIPRGRTLSIQSGQSSPNLDRRRTDGGSVAPMGHVSVTGMKRKKREKEEEPKVEIATKVQTFTETQKSVAKGKCEKEEKTEETLSASLMGNETKQQKTRRNRHKDRHTWDGQEYKKQKREMERGTMTASTPTTTTQTKSSHRSKPRDKGIKLSSDTSPSNKTHRTHKTHKTKKTDEGTNAKISRSSHQRKKGDASKSKSGESTERYNRVNKTTETHDVSSVTISSISSSTNTTNSSTNITNSSTNIRNSATQTSDSGTNMTNSSTIVTNSSTSITNSGATGNITSTNYATMSTTNTTTTTTSTNSGTTASSMTTSTTSSKPGKKPNFFRNFRKSILHKKDSGETETETSKAKATVNKDVPKSKVVPNAKDERGRRATVH